LAPARVARDRAGAELCGGLGDERAAPEPEKLAAAGISAASGSRSQPGPATKDTGPRQRGASPNGLDTSSTPRGGRALLEEDVPSGSDLGRSTGETAKSVAVVEVQVPVARNGQDVGLGVAGEVAV
jgi:hypothetical protein